MEEVVPESIQKLIKLQEDVNSGKVKISPEQQEKLEKLIKAYHLSVESQQKLNKIKTCVLYERLVYLGKCQVLEKIGCRNSWNHDLLLQTKDVLYKENQFFELVDKKE